MARTMARSKQILGGKSSRNHSYTREGASPPRQHATARVTRSQAKNLTRTITPEHAAILQSGIAKGKKPAKRRKHLDPWYPKRKVNQNPKPRAPPPTHFTCRICINTLRSTNFVPWISPRRARTARILQAPFRCISHLAKNPYRRNIDPVCKSCIGLTMSARLDTLGARRVSVGCLEPGCDTVWPWEMVLKYFPVEKLEVYNIAMLDVWKTDTELFTCLSPSCSAFGLPDPSAPGYPQIQCHACTFRSCATCLTPWHVDQTCAEVSAATINAQMTDPEKNTLELMQSKDGKRCPNCHLVIEKDGGCDSMFCPSCTKYFSWSTAASAVPGTKKALPVLSGQGNWQTPGTVVCEVDRLEGKVPDIVAGDGAGGWAGFDEGVLEEFDFNQFLHGPNAVGTFEWPQMPLPGVDDADL